MDKVALDDSYDQHVPNTDGNTKGNSCSITEGHATRFGKTTDDQPSSLCLDSNPSRPVSPQLKSKSKSRYSSGSAGKPQDPTCSKRSRKKSRRDRDHPTVQNSASDMPQQANQSSVVSSHRNKRKRARRTASRKTDTSLIADANVESPNSTKKDEVG